MPGDGRSRYGGECCRWGVDGIDGATNVGYLVAGANQAMRDTLTKPSYSIALCGDPLREIRDRLRTD